MTLMKGTTILGESASSTVIDHVEEMDRSSKEIAVKIAVEHTRLDVEEKLLAIAAKVDRLEKGLDEVRSGTAVAGFADRLPPSSALNNSRDPWPSALFRTIHRLPM